LSNELESGINRLKNHISLLSYLMSHL